MEREKLFSLNVLEKPATKRASRLAGNIDFETIRRMGYNENPYGMPESVLEAMKEAEKKAYFYPNFAGSGLKKALAEMYDVEEDNIAVGAGSSALISIVGQAFLNVDDEVILCPTFAAFNDMIEMARAKTITVPLTEDKGYDLDGILEKVNDKTKMVVITNPNNPTGQYLSYDAIESFVQKLDKNVVVLIDEAYIELATAPDCKTMLPLIKKYPEHPILVMRTFSKYYAMAGVRVGYLIAQKELIDGINVVPGSSVARGAQAAAVQALKEQEYYSAQKEKVVAGARYIEEELRKLGCEVYPTQTNFILFEPHMDYDKVPDQLIEKGIHISTPMMDRVSVSTQENNEYFIQCMKEILEGSK